MARGDLRPTKSNYRGGSYGGSSQSYYDDEGRGKSKDIWEWFESNFTAKPTEDWLLGLSDQEYYSLVKNSTTRFNLMDILWTWKPGWSVGEDTRAHRLVIKKLSEASWLKFYEAAIAGYLRHKEKRELELHQAATERDGQWAAYQAQRDAEQAIVDRADELEMRSAMQLTAGELQADLNMAIVGAEAVGSAGEWIDDVVDAYQGGGDGFGYASTKAHGVKMQITLCLDLSNSMRYNGIAKQAAETFRDAFLALLAMKEQYQDNLYIAAFTFSEDEWGGDSKAGKRARQVFENVQLNFAEPYTAQSGADMRNFGELSNYRPSKLDERSMFDGTDTWISPLFEQIEAWERKESDPGAVRLDLIITDAVLEHPGDIRLADVIQERRNGSLYSLFMNFMPEKDWLNSTMPKRCYQTKVDVGNVAAMLRNAISEFVAAHV